MKKAVKFLTLVLVLCLVATGCAMKENMTIKVSKDKKVTFAVLVAYDDEFIDTMLSMGSDDEESDEESDEEKTYTDAERWEYVDSSILESAKENNYKYEKYSEGNFKGYKVFYTDAKNIDDLVGSGDRVDLLTTSEIDGVKFFTKDGNTYKSNMKFDMSKSEDLSSVSSNASSMDLFEIKLTVELPTKPSSNNADEVSKDGKTLTWDMTKDAKNVDFSFTFDGASSSNNNTIIYVAAGAAIVLVVVVAAVVVSKKNKPVQ